MKNSFFIRNPKKTIFFTILFFSSIGIIIVDFSLTLYLKKLNSFKEEKFNKDYVNIRIADPIYHHTFLPKSISKEYESRTGIYTLYTNSLGFKDNSTRDISLNKKEKRILMIGDSFTEGILLNYEDTFVGMIDKELKKYNIEILNAGRSSYSPIIYWKKIEYLIEEVGLEFDEVIVFLDICDPMNEIIEYDLSEKNNVVSRQNKNINLKMETKKSEKPFITSLKEFIYNNTTMIYSILNFLYDTSEIASNEAGEWSYILNTNEYDRWTINNDENKTLAKKGNILMKKYMNKLFDLLNKNNIELSIAVFPRPTQIWYEDLNSIHVKIWHEWSKERNIKLYNFFPEFFYKKNRTDIEKITFFKENFIIGDYHYNKNGNKIIARKFLDLYKNNL